MLTPEQAREQLQSFKVADAEKRRAKRLRSLPASARKHLQHVTDECVLSEMEMADVSKAYFRLGEFLDGLAPAKRLAIFEALQPRLAPLLERLWRAAIAWPYQASWSRKAFRAPNTPEVTWPVRVARLRSIVRILDDFEPDIVWVATWAAHLSVYGDGLEVGSFLAGAIDEPDDKADEVFDILCASVRGDHEIGAMGRHVVQAFLASSRQDAWEVVERMLVGAQREEGLRQVILECADLAHPTAFRRMLRLILEHDLARFSTVTYTLNLWLGYQWDSASVRVVNATISRLLAMLDDTDAREKALVGDDAEAVYLALWCHAFEDALAVVPRAVEVLGVSDESRRFVAARLLTQLEHSVAQEALVPVVDDPDIRVATQAVYAFSDEVIATVATPGLFDRIAQFVARLPKRKTTTQSLVWPWGTFTIDRYSGGSALLNSLGDRPITQIIPHLSALNPARRNEVAERLTTLRSWDAQCREALVTFCGDSSASVRATAIDAIGARPVAEQDARALEKLLTRRAEDLRRAVLKVLAGQAERAALASTKRLLASDEEAQRLGGLELLRLLHEAGRDRRAVRKHLDGFRAARELTAAEQHIVGLLEEARPSVVTLDNALGLMDPSQRDRTVPPRPLKVVWATDAARECPKSLDACVHEHREATITIKGYDDREQSVLLGSVTWGFPSVFQGQRVADIDTLPLRELWEAWWQHRPATQRDADGYELIRAVASVEGAFSGSLPRGHSGPRKLLRRFLARDAEDSSLRYDQIVGNVVWWLLRLHPPDGATDFLLDAIEASFAAVPNEVLARKVDPEKWDDPDWRNQSPFIVWVEIARNWQGIQPDRWSPEQHSRLWRLLRWADEPGTGVQRNRAQMEEVVEAFEAGAATEADLYDQLLGLRPQGRWHGDFNDLRRLTKRTPPPELKRCAALAHAVEACRKRILDIELDRGEPATPATQPASSLSYIEGTETLVRILTRLGRGKLVRSSFQESRSGVFSHLIRVCCPAETDTPEAFAAQVRTAGIGEQRLIELAAFAPQWAACVEHALGAPGLADGVWWIHAHTKDDQWHVEQEIREIWKAEASRRTPLTGADLIDGAVDVGWFRRVFEQLGADRWATLAECAKYASDGTGHARAKLFAEAMLGRVAKDELVRRINEKRNKDAARALGLLPLAQGKVGQADLLDRYERLQEFLRTSRKYGAQRRASEKRATEIGLENLARTAGYPDPLRLQWAMETASLADLAAGPVVVKAGEVSVSLAIDDEGVPGLTVQKKDRVLKTIPPAVKKKHPAVAEITARKTALKQQVSRIRASLEQAMCRGDAFTGGELRGMFGHPMLRPMLSRLVWIGEGIAGYPTEGGHVLRDHAGNVEPVKADEALRLAHPHDLLRTGEWHLWQRECFQAERIQPFKQVFRELYVLTAAEASGETESHRYEGHQVHPRQALALLGARGWVHFPEEGVRRTYHTERLAARLVFEDYFMTPAEIEGLTIASVLFHPRDDWKPVLLAQVPPRVFSETMRDLDLVVSVAHRGGVDPEASASTLEMRAALVRDTCAMLGFENVRLNNRHVLIDGRLGDYSVHLGSAVVHRLPGGHLCIVPVHAQQRGRLFLPFADDDPKTAEVVSKVCMLARDHEIKDPTILEQIRRSP